MKIKYDKEVDIIYITLSEEEIEESIENKPGVIIDYDKEGNVVGLEILQASEKTTSPTSVIYELGDWKSHLKSLKSQHYLGKDKQ